MSRASAVMTVYPVDSEPAGEGRETESTQWQVFRSRVMEKNSAIERSPPISPQRPEPVVGRGIVGGARGSGAPAMTPAGK